MTGPQSTLHSGGHHSDHALNTTPPQPYTEDLGTKAEDILHQEREERLKLGWGYRLCFSSFDLLDHISRITVLVGSDHICYVSKCLQSINQHITASQ